MNHQFKRKSSENNETHNSTSIAKLMDFYVLSGVSQPDVTTSDGINDYILCSPFVAHIQIDWIENDQGKKCRGNVIGDIFWQYSSFYCSADHVASGKNSIYPVGLQTERVTGAVTYNCDRGGSMFFYLRTKSFGVLDTSISSFSDDPDTETTEEMPVDQVTYCLNKFQKERTYNITYTLSSADIDCVMNNVSAESENDSDEDERWNVSMDDWKCDNRLVFESVVNMDSLDMFNKVIDFKACSARNVIGHIQSQFKPNAKRIGKLMNKLSSILDDPLSSNARSIVPLQGVIPADLNAIFHLLGFIENENGNAGFFLPQSIDSILIMHLHNSFMGLLK